MNLKKLLIKSTTVRGTENTFCQMMVLLQRCMLSSKFLSFHKYFFVFRYSDVLWANWSWKNLHHHWSN